LVLHTPGSRFLRYLLNPWRTWLGTGDLQRGLRWLIYKIPKPFFSKFQYVDTGNSGNSCSDGDDSDNEFLANTTIANVDIDNMTHDDFWH
jgi:hypothetical protein